MNVPEKYREIAHSWVDGAIIQCFSTSFGWGDTNAPSWDQNKEYRIDPLCDYAINLISEHNREAYIHLCNGGEIQVLSAMSNEWEDADGFCIKDKKFKYRIKPLEVKKWQWLVKLSNGTCCVTSQHYSEHGVLNVKAYKVIRKIEETEQEFFE